MHTKLGFQSQAFKRRSSKFKDAKPGIQSQESRSSNPKAEIKSQESKLRIQRQGCQTWTLQSRMMRIQSPVVQSRTLSAGILHQSQESNCKNLGPTANSGAGIRSQASGAGNPKPGLQNLQPISRSLKLRTQIKESRAWNSMMDIENQEAKNRNLTAGRPK